MWIESKKQGLEEVADLLTDLQLHIEHLFEIHKSLTQLILEACKECDDCKKGKECTHFITLN